MNAFLEWCSMGGYFAYVWSAYGLVCFVLAINLMSVRWQKIKTRQMLTRWFKR